MFDFLSFQLENWADAVRGYEVLRMELPDDIEVLVHPQVALKKLLGEEVVNMEFSGDCGRSVKSRAVQGSYLSTRFGALDT